MERLGSIERFAGSPVSLNALRPAAWATTGRPGMLIRKVEKFLRDHDMPANKFGRLAANDPRFVLDLRMGRVPRPATEKRTLQWMEDYAGKAVSPSPAFRSAPITREIAHV